jgi:tetratricopeptide (TPR) repeat protein
MIKRMLVVLAVGAVLLSVSAHGQAGKPAKEKSATAEKSEEAYQAMAEKRRGTEVTAEKLAFTKDFLDEFPETDRTASALAAAFYYQGEAMGDMADAVAYAESIRGKIGDPEVAKAVDKEMLYVYGASQMFSKMTEVADRLAADGSLAAEDHATIIEAAAGGEEWKLALEYCEKGISFATEESYRKEHPDRQFKEGEIERAVNYRRGFLLVMGGWSRANLGEVDRALADFESADKIVSRSYFGTGDHNLNLYWGQTLLMKGDHAAAAEKLAADALVMRDEKALTGLRRAYAAIHGGDAGFDEYAAELHRSIAKSVGDFELADYSGKRHRLSDLRKDVTLLAFWFPT